MDHAKYFPTCQRRLDRVEHSRYVGLLSRSDQYRATGPNSDMRLILVRHLHHVRCINTLGCRHVPHSRDRQVGPWVITVPDDIGNRFATSGFEASDAEVDELVLTRCITVEDHGFFVLKVAMVYQTSGNQVASNELVAELHTTCQSN